MRHLYFYVASALQARVEQPAAAAGVKTAPWLRHMLRQIAITDFPKSWQEARSEERSHDSRVYGKRFMMRLDHLTQEKLDGLSTHFDISIAEVIRQLVAQAKIQDFPSSWQMRAAERRTRQPSR